jgi:transposase
MSQRQRVRSAAEEQLPSQLSAVNLHAAGIDVGGCEHWVAVPHGADPQPVRRFGGCTPDLEALADWLRACGVTTVALESTGVYWIALYELLESRGFEVRLVDPRQFHQVSGRPKSDVHDCQWLQRLHSYGLLAGAFRPAELVCVLRSYLRQRSALVAEAARDLQHLQKALTQMNVKLQHVVADVAGLTGLRIIRAVLAGERDPARLAQLRDRRCKQDEAAIARALHGNWRAEHLFALEQALASYEFRHRQMAECDRRIEAELCRFADRSGGAPLPPRPGKRAKGKARRNQVPFDARGRLYRMAGVDLTLIEGIEEPTALALLGEIGLDMSRWPTAKHFCSWLGLCPQRRVSGGKLLSSRVQTSSSRAALALRLAARGLERSKSGLGAFFRRLKARLGAPKAITAAAHKLGRLVYSLLRHGTAYVAQGLDEYERRYRERAVRGLNRRARELGYELVERETPVAATSPAAAQ